MKQIFKNYTAEKPVRSVVNETPDYRFRNSFSRPSSNTSSSTEPLFSRGVSYTKKHAKENI